MHSGSAGDFVVDVVRGVSSGCAEGGLTPEALRSKMVKALPVVSWCIACCASLMQQDERQLSICLEHNC